MTATINGISFMGDRNEDSNSYSSLCKHSIETCDFCEKIFNNRFSILVHTSKHIIIPLLKQTLLQCGECLFHFSSQEDLNDHIVRKHPELMSVMQTVNTECRVNVEPLWIDKMKLPQCNRKRVDSVSVIASDTLQSIVEQRKPLMEFTEESSLKNRIIFEDHNDIISVNSNGLLDDFTKDSKVNMEMFEAPWLHHNDDDKYRAESNEAEFYHNISGVTDNWTSVHYDELVAAGEFNCKYCGKIYSNRLRLIQHEPKHIRFKRPQPVLCPHCDWYVSGNRRSLYRHIDKTHPSTTANIKSPQKTCRQCGLKYHNYSHHEKNYHKFVQCNTCNKQVDLENMEHHILEHQDEGFPKKKVPGKFWATKVVKVCDLCFSFFKNKQNLHYVHLKDINELGVRQTCDKCDHKFFTVKLVKLVQRPRESHLDERRKKPMSNKDRLKNIQHRLKKINKLNKY